MKEVACARGVGDADFVGRRIPETSAIPSEGAVNPERRTNSSAAVGSFEKRKRFEKIALAGSGAGQVAGRDRIIDEREKSRELRGPMVEIGNDWDAFCSSP